MKILSVEFTDKWSWGLICRYLVEHSEKNEYERFFLDSRKPIKTKGFNVIMAQNAPLLERFTERLRTICRLGGNRNFDDAHKDGIEQVIQNISQCYCVIATNQKLFDIASGIHDRVYLIPNGIDLNEWAPVKKKHKKKLVVGFCGNISNRTYREYKGYDFIASACNYLRVELKSALYKLEQIPHDEMREKFYSEIDVLVHPTLGEGSSNTIMEACACGVPVITTKEAGFHGELMRDGEDVLFCERSVASIQGCIQRLIDDKKLYDKLCKGSRAFAEKHHDITKIAPQFEAIFEECDKYNRVLPKKIIIRKIIKNALQQVVNFSCNGVLEVIKLAPNLTNEDIIRSITEKKNKEEREIYEQENA